MESAGSCRPGGSCRGGGYLACAFEGARVLAASALLAILTAGAAPAQATQAPDTPVATVGDETITGREYVEYLGGYLRSKLYHGGSPERVRELAEEALDTLIEKELLTQAAEERGIPADQEAVAARIAQLREQYGASENWPAIEPRLPEIEQKLLAQSRIKALREKVSEVSPPDEADLRAFHAARPELFTQPSAWDLDLILLKVAPSATALEWVEARQRAEELGAELKEGAAFEDLARENSTHGSAEAGGALGRVHKGQLPAEAEAAIAELEPGEVTAPLRLLEGYALFRLNERFEARLQPFEVVRDRVEALYLRERSAERLAAFIEDLRATTPVETFDISAHVDAFLTKE